MKKKEPSRQQSKKILQCENVSVKFDDFLALNSFSFQLKEHELHFLIGPNGAGKTTFLDVLCGKTKSSTGKLLFKKEYDLSKMKEYQIARHGIGRKFQAPSIFPHLTVFENLEVSMKQKKGLFSILTASLSDSENERITNQLRTIGLTNEKDKKAINLSHGQKQWLEIGMVMMQEPDLLLLDEPIAGMTEEEEETTGHLLRELKKECSIIVVEHDMDFVEKYSERVTVMHEGSLLCEGSMREVQQNEQVMEVYLGRKEVPPYAATSGT